MIVAVTLGGCMATTQTSSGSDYLAQYPKTGSMPMAEARGDPAQATGNLDEAVRRAADVEPTAHFPMKICLARVTQYGGLIEPPADELPLWGSLEDRLGPGYGTFAVLSPMVAAFAAINYARPAHEDPTSRLAADVRLGAARQHCDTAFIYEPHTSAVTKDTPLQLLNWTIVGYFIVPSTGVTADGSAQALLIDVRTGYPYAQITGVSQSETFTTGNSRGNAMQNHTNIARLSAIANLIGKIPGALASLRDKLQN
jgi:hypothetical protein